MRSRRRAILDWASVVLVVLSGACAVRPPPPAQAGAAPEPNVQPPPEGTAPASFALPARTKKTGCLIRAALPDPGCTPGAVSTTELHVVCSGSTRERRHVDLETRRQVFAEYGIAYPQPRGTYEVDHLIPLELGGDNSIANLWPEPAAPPPGFHEKDEVENTLHAKVCAGVLALAEAQRLIANDWVAEWRRLQQPAPD